MLQTLMRFLPLAEKVISRKATLPILSHVCIRDGYIGATDLETTVRMKIATHLNYTIPLTLLKTILKARPKLLEVELPAEGKVTITYDTRRITFKALDPEAFPVWPSGRFRRVGQWTGEVLRKLYKQLPYCSVNELKPALRGVYVKQNKVLSSCATDGRVLRLIKDADPRGQGRLEKDFAGILPGKSLLILSRLAQGKVPVAHQPGYLRFTLPGGRELAVRLITERYPDYESVIPTEFSGATVLDRPALLKLLREARPLAGQPPQLAALQLTGKTLKIEVADPDRETFWEAPFPVISRSGKALRIGMNLVLLERILKGVEQREVLWQYTTPVSASLFTGANGSGKEVVNLIMPICLNEEPEGNHG